MSRLFGRPKPEIQEKSDVVTDADDGRLLMLGERVSRIETEGDPDEPVERRYLIRRPKAHQWFEDNVLMKASCRERVAGKFELFYDLLYVALIANFAEKLADEPSGDNLVLFLITFITAWHVWADEKEHANNYYNDDLIQRLNILWIMALLILFGNNANYVAEDISYLRITVATYQVIRFSQAGMFFYNSMGDFRHRVQNRAYVVAEIFVLFLWIPMYFEEVSNRAKVAVAFVAIAVEELGWIFTFGPWIGRWLGLKHRTALDIPHESDRFTAFTIIVLGEFTYALLFGSPARGGLNFGYLRAVLTLIIAFCFNAMYIYADGSIRSVHPARRSVFSATTWLMIHLPMSAGLLIAGHVASGAVVEEMNEGRRWLLGGGLANGFFTLWINSFLFHDADPSGKLVMPKFFRMFLRLASTFIMALLPLTSSETINDTAFLGIASALTVGSVVWETYGAFEKGVCFCESWKDEHPRVTSEQTEDDGTSREGS